MEAEKIGKINLRGKIKTISMSFFIFIFNFNITSFVLIFYFLFSKNCSASSNHIKKVINIKS